MNDNLILIEEYGHGYNEDAPWSAVVDCHEEIIHAINAHIKDSLIEDEENKIDIFHEKDGIIEVTLKDGFEMEFHISYLPPLNAHKNLDKQDQPCYNETGEK